MKKVQGEQEGKGSGASSKNARGEKDLVLQGTQKKRAGNVATQKCGYRCQLLEKGEKRVARGA